MPKLGSFHRDENGSMVENVALVSAVIALACVFGANLLSTMLQNGGLPVIAFVHADGQQKRLARSAPAAGAGQAGPIFKGTGVDMSTTASIPGAGRAAQGVSPCEKDRK